ncbi:Floral homeotic protein APETALA 3 [Citrus sinensis]|nr:floral homeotic protein DEFICIENS [Citrus x clementina]XP_006473587.2 agamous-like MADS-box protein AP3 [Citrus sinensis]KAH9693204.1 Floral homeotic protein APETALA 3 [Citrus sinensis]
MNMARGKIQIKRIENATNRQVTFSKRRNGLFKKAQELTVLCDAKVSIIMCSSTGKVQEYVSSSTTTKQLLDEYQRRLKIDLWSSQYEKMQENLKNLKEVNINLKKEIRQRLGESLNDLSLKKLSDLEQDVDNCLRIIRERKLRAISGQIVTHKKKVRREEEENRKLRNGFIINAKEEDQHYELVDNEGHYDSVIRFQNGGPGIFALRLQPNEPLSSQWMSIHE